jgi:oxazoline/thiazoline synthase
MTVAGEAPDAGGTPVAFRRDLHVEVSGDQVHLFSERAVRRLRGRAVAAVAPLLDGTRALDEVVRQAPADVDPGTVRRTVDRLVDAGLVGPAAPAGPDAAYWHAAGLDAGASAAAVRAARVAVRTVGPVGGAVSTATAAALRAGGTLEPAGPDAPVDLTVVLCADYLDPELAAVDAGLRRLGSPWLLAKPAGTRVWIGPLFDPAEPGCWQCLADRLGPHRRAESCAQAELGRCGPAAVPDASLPALGAAAANLVALVAAQWLAGLRQPAQRAVWTLDSLRLDGRHHEFRARPQCPACGDPGLTAARAHQPVRLGSRARAAGDRAGHRALDPDAVRARYGHLVSPVTGIVKEIARNPVGPAFLNSYRSGPNLAATAPDLDGLAAAVRFHNGGKGVTAAHAEVSALGEAVERHCGTYQGDEAVVVGSLRGLGERALHPNDWQLFDPRQFTGREAWNRAHSAFQYVPPEFDPDAELPWTPVWSLGEQRHRLLPTGLLYYGVPARPGQPAPHADSNGCAAGSSLEDAVLHALLELVERDAVALWWYNRGRLPGIDLDAVTDPWLAEVRAGHAELGRELWVLDGTADLGIPVHIAVSRRTGSPEELLFGFGAHLDARHALRRAVAELNQLLPAVLDRSAPCPDPDAEDWWRTGTLAGHPYLAPDPAVPARVPRPGPDEPDLAAEVELVRSRLAGAGLDVLLLDQTRPDVGLPVVRAVVPGLRHFWARLGPGRLFDVPVRLGRQAAPTPYEQLNPVAMFL